MTSTVGIIGIIDYDLTFPGQLRDAIRYRVQDGPRELDVLHWMGRTALELIGQGGLGYTFDPLVEDRIDPYGEALKAIVYVSQSY